MEQLLRNIRQLTWRTLLLLLLCSGSATAADPSGQTPPGAAPTPETAAAAPLSLFNRTVATFRYAYFGVAPADRAVRAKAEILRVLNKGGEGTVTSETTPAGKVVLIDKEFVFTLFPQDVEPLSNATLEQVTQKTVNELTLVVNETKESRDVTAMLRAAGLSSLATGILSLLVWLLRRLREWIAIRVLPLAQQKSAQLQVGGEAILHHDFVYSFVRRLLWILYWTAILILFYEWLGYVLARFPYTRPWGEQLMQYLLTVASNIVGGALKAVPNLLIAAIIVVLAKGIINLLGSLFDRVESGQITLAWLDCDTVRPTRRIVSGAIWIFTLAMAYPYLPGSQTAAFKGMSVLVGLMISLGGSSLVGQAASGLILMFTRTLRQGEYVSISDKEGTVVELGLFATRIRNGMGEELTLPNSLILGSVTKNYSRTVEGHGFVLSTTVTIGYDTPWRQIHAMLIEAARRTDGVLREPQPRVFQVALSDYYPEYRLTCQAVPTTPLPRAEILTALHANIQDVFNEYGVQIMSPHYMGDPADAKTVSAENLYAAPAVPPNGSRQDT